tara:strand:- start:8873 stop:9367 length:495 start_codon:yes stop_codon:yes gene_type:complete
MAGATEFDILEEDTYEQLAMGQRYGVISVTRSLEGPDQKTYVAVKLKGCFGTNEQAQEHANAIAKINNKYDIFVCPLGKWLMLPPDLTKIDDQQHQDQMLTNIMNNHNDKQELERIDFDERKHKLMQGTMTPEGKQIGGSSGSTSLEFIQDQQPHPTTTTVSEE